MSLVTALSLVTPSEADWPALWRLADRLHELGYTEQGVSAAMKVADHCSRDWREWPAHLRNCRRVADEQPCALLASFFLIEALLEKPVLEDLLGVEAAALMARLEWTLEVEGKVHFRYFLYPVLGSFILTDGFSSNPPTSRDQVYILGADSHMLARMAPRPRVAASLDHCTGSGVHAVLSAGHSGHAYGVDINPRALQFARLNAKLNRRPNSIFLRSDCYEKFRRTPDHEKRPSQFDLITANPPFVPAPEPLTLCRGGGLSGEEVTEKIVRGLPEKLSPNGIFSMVTNIPIMRQQTFFARCREWLGSQECWSILVLTTHVWSVPSYVVAHQGEPAQESYGDSFVAWLDAYETVGLEAVSSSLVYVFRSATPLDVERICLPPRHGVADFIEDWITSMRSYKADETAHYRIHPTVEKISWLDDGRRAYLEWRSDHQWWEPRGVWLEGAAARALAGIQRGSREGLEDEGLFRLLGAHLITLAKGSPGESPVS